MIELPFDYTRCNPRAGVCLSKEGCSRFTSKWKTDGLQSCMDSSAMIKDNDAYCDMFIANSKEYDV